MATTKSKKAAAPAKRPKNESAGKSDADLEKLFFNALKDIYWAEKHLLKAIPKLQRASTAESLQKALENHLQHTETHVTRLEKVFEDAGKIPVARRCEAMEALSREAAELIEETEKGSSTRDAGIIMAAQKVEHYEIACYGTLVQFARLLNMDKAAELFEETLNEEKEADALLSTIAEDEINRKAEVEY